MLATSICNIHIFYFEKKKTVTILYTTFIIMNNIKLIYNLHHALTLQIINEIILIWSFYTWVIMIFLSNKGPKSKSCLNKKLTDVLVW